MARPTKPAGGSPARGVPEIAPEVVHAVAGVLASLGVPDTTGDPDELFDRAETFLGDPLVGIAVASRVPVGAYGLLEYGMRASATVGEALARLARYYASVSTRIKVEVSTVDGRRALLFLRHPRVKFSRHWIEMPAAAIAGRLAEGAGAPILEEVRFEHAAPRADLEQRYRARFRAPVRFESTVDALVLRDGAVDRPMRTHAAQVATSVDRVLDVIEPALDFPDPFRLRLRSAILARLSAGPTLAIVARDLGMSSRTLQRIVSEHGSSWSAELDDVRRDRALELLACSDRKTAEVAAELGFRDASAFFRAFRRWTGGTPKGHGQKR